MSGSGSKSASLARYGAIGALLAYLPGELVQIVFGGAGAVPTFLRILALTSTWMGIFAIGYTLSLTFGQNKYLKRPGLQGPEITRGIIGGALVGFLSGFSAQLFFTIAVVVGQGNVLLTEMARIVAWAIFGAMIGVGMSFVIPNLGRAIGASWGAIGGGVGAIGFILCSALLGDQIGRLAGMAIVGAALGYSIGMAEEASRHAWLEATYGSAKEIVRVSLGATPVCVGSNSQACSIWAQGARPVELRFRFIDNRVLCDDLGKETTFEVAPDAACRIGNVVVTVKTGVARSAGAAYSGGSVSAGTAPPSSPPRVPPPPPPPPPPPRRPSG
jgi:hypothetical protein